MNREIKFRAWDMIKNNWVTFGGNWHPKYGSGKVIGNIYENTELITDQK